LTQDYVSGQLLDVLARYRRAELAFHEEVLPSQAFSLSGGASGISAGFHSHSRGLAFEAGAG
jgi:hypothetical protein